MDWYDRAEEYDILFGWNPATERDFILAASARWGLAEPRRTLEPFCGPGRLLRAMPGIAVGFDRNPHMVRYAARDCRVFRADAAHFAVRDGSFDLAYCLIDSFRHLLREEDAAAHLRAVARALRPGAVYVLGFEVTGDGPPDVSAEEWSESRGAIRIHGRVRGLGDADPTTRVETVRVQLEIERGPDPGSREQIDAYQPMRLYARHEFEDLVDDEGSFEIAAAFDRGYDLARPREISEIDGSAVFVLRRSA